MTRNNDQSAEIANLRAELIYRLKEIANTHLEDMLNGWERFDPWGENAALRLVELGAWEQHPNDPRLFKAKKEQHDDQE